MSFAPKIGNYRFSKNLGVGTFGKVKLAYNELTGHKVAIKILNKKKIKQQGVFEKVKREIKVLRKFNHPHIIKHFEYIDTTSDIFIVLEYAAGGELFDLISRKKRLDEDEARRIFQQIISAIDYSHVQKMAHRDLKPENLLLDEDNNIKLIDFGLANSMKDGASLTTACGSPNYAAPEVIAGAAYGGQEVDVWSCGVILYAMVYGTLPFEDEVLPILFQKIKEGRYFLHNDRSRELRDLINRMLQPNPVRRIKLREIQQHPWYLAQLPQYMHELSCLPMRYEQAVDQDIVRQLFDMDKKIAKTFDEVVKDIAEKRTFDYVGSYELIKHDKLKRECFDKAALATTQQFGAPPQTTSAQVAIVSQQNYRRPDTKQLLGPKQLDRLAAIQARVAARRPAKDNYVSEKGQPSTTGARNFVGLAFDGDPNQALVLVCAVLRDLDYEWQHQRDKKLKCRIMLDRQPLLDDEQFIQEFLNKRYLRFNLSIFKEPQTKANTSHGPTSQHGCEQAHYAICAQLVKGSQMVFLDLVQVFFQAVRDQISNNTQFESLRLI